jgi:hypothetical protein
MDIEEIFEDGEWIGNDEFLIRCPFCGDGTTHNHCFVNPYKKVFHCYRCHEKGTLRKLAEKVEVTHLEPRVGITEKKKYEPIEFSQFPKLTGKAGITDKDGWKYLIDKRKLTPNEIKNYDIRIGINGRYYGRVIIPIIEESEIVCFTARSIYAHIEPKYLFPHHGEMKLTTSEAIFGYDKLRKAHPDDKRDIVIVEGAFDAIAIEKKTSALAMSFLSNHMSNGQFVKFQNRDIFPIESKYYIMMDEDAYEEGYKMAKRISQHRRTWLVKLDVGDPDSLSVKKLKEALDLSKEIKSEDLDIEHLL